MLTLLLLVSVASFAGFERPAQPRPAPPPPVCTCGDSLAKLTATNEALGASVAKMVREVDVAKDDVAKAEKAVVRAVLERAAMERSRDRWWKASLLCLGVSFFMVVVISLIGGSNARTTSHK